MNKNLMLLSGAVALVLGAGTAFAGGSEGSIGVGAEAQLNGLQGLSMNFDAGPFHAGGFLAFSDGDGDDNTDIALGGRFYYHLHATSMADFGIGGAIGVALLGDRMPTVDNDETHMFIEPGFQIRAFLASNVALSFTGGISLGVADAEGVGVNGQLNGAAGVHYYFY